MRVRILFQITDDAGASGAPEEIAVFEKASERSEDLGLLIDEGKALLAAIQQKIVLAQAAAWSERHRDCEDCGRRPVGSNLRAAGSPTVRENSQGRTWTATNVRR
jgi:hypothetical protein